MADTILHPTEIEETPFPGEMEVIIPQAQTGSKDIISPTTTKPKTMPTKRTAVELLSSALNTRSKKVLGMFDLTNAGGFRIGKYENGVSGDVRLTPGGMTARNSAGNTTFALDGDTGDAIFAGQLQSGSLVTGVVNVGDGDIQIDGANKRMVFFDEDGVASIVIGNG